MKKLIALLVVVLVVFAVLEKNRLFVRDPLGSVTRDGSKVDGEQIYVNHGNDVLLENDNPPMLVMLIERGQPIGVPTKLRCIHWVGCLTDADIATTYALGGTIKSMTSKQVSFRDEKGQNWIVTLH